MEAEFVFPDVGIGETVLYKTQPGSKQAYAMKIVHRGDDSIEGIVFFYDSGSGCQYGYKTGVRHQSDPRLQDPTFLHNLLADGDGGVFVEDPGKLRLLARIEALEAALGAKAVEVPVASAGKKVRVVTKNESPLKDTPKMKDRFKEPSKVDQAEKSSAISAARI